MAICDVDEKTLLKAGENPTEGVHALDMEGIESGRLKPTHMMAALVADPIDNATVYRHLTPEFITRWPDPGPWRRTLRGPRVRRKPRG